MSTKQYKTRQGFAVFHFRSTLENNSMAYMVLMAYNINAQQGLVG